jgi:hypothetical protein
MPADARAAQTSRWISGPSLGFLLVHLAGCGYALAVLVHALPLRTLLQILYGHGAWLLLGALVPIPVLSLLEARVTLRNLRRNEREPDLALRLRAALYVALGCLLLDVFVLSIRIDLVAEMSVTFAYGAYCMWRRLLPLCRRILSARLRSALDVVGMNTALVLILGEVGLRAIAVVFPSPLLTTRYSSQHVRISADRSPPGTLRFGFPINRGGHYDTEFAPRSPNQGPLVVSIGDSFSYGAVPHAFHYTTIAEEDLRGVEIYNMGFPAIGPTEYRYLLEREALPLKPDLVVIQLFLGNDITDAPQAEGPPTWYQKDRYLGAVLLQRLQILWRARTNALSASGATGRTELTREQLVARYPWLADPLVESPTFPRDLFLDVETKRAGDVCGPIEAIYAHFFAELDDLQRAAAGAPLAFVLIPDEFQVEDSLWGDVQRRAAVPLDRDRPQRKVLDWLAARGLPVLDLLPILRAVEPLKDGRKHLYQLQDTHFNVRGNAVEGHALAGWIRSLLPKSKGP